MDKRLKQRDGEPLHEWIDRVAAALVVPWEVHEAMSEISRVSYLVGSNDATDILRKTERR